MSKKRCAACRVTEGLTRHHVYPRYLREVWQRQVKQVMVVLCRTCHDVVHLRSSLRQIRWATRENPACQPYKDRWTDPDIQEVLGPLRRVIRALERESRAIHLS